MLTATTRPTRTGREAIAAAVAVAALVAGLAGGWFSREQIAPSSAGRGSAPVVSVAGNADRTGMEPDTADVVRSAVSSQPAATLPLGCPSRAGGPFC
jgi:hypothetical protein